MELSNVNVLYIVGFYFSLLFGTVVWMIRIQIKPIKKLLDNHISETTKKIDNLNNNTNQRFDNLNNNINQRFDNLNNNTNQRFDNLNSRFDDVYKILLEIQKDKK